MIRPVALISALCCCGTVAAQGVTLPPSIPSFGQDEFHASDGTSCRSSMDGAKRVEAGAYGTDSRYDDRAREPAFHSISRGPSQNIGAYVRFSISLDARKKRMDCNKLYELELQKKELELNVMKQSLEAAEEKLRALEKPSDATGSGEPPL